MYWLIEKARNFNDTKSVLSKINWFEMTIYQQEPDNSEHKNIVSDLYKKLDQKIAYLNSKKIACWKHPIVCCISNVGMPVFSIPNPWYT